MSKLYAIGNYFGAHLPFQDMFESCNIVLPHILYKLEEIEKGDVILFGGGEDISPSIYNETKSRWTFAPQKYSRRDQIETEVFENYKGKAKFLGICRGAQLLCALAGGKLVQHIDNHSGAWHYITTKKGERYHVSSAHHQLQWPWAIPHELLAWSEEQRSSIYEGTINDLEMYFPTNAYVTDNKGKAKAVIEPEVVYYPEIEALAIQYHPEFMSNEAEGVAYSKRLVKEYLLETK